MPYEKVGKNDPVCIADEVPFEIPESWEWVRLFNLGDNINDAFADGPFGSNLKKDHYTDRKEVRLIQLSNIGEEGWRNENTKYTTYSHAETLSRSMVKPGAIVIAKMMPAGRAIIVPDCEKDYILSSDAVKFIPHNLLNVDYLVIAINSPAFRNQVVSEAHGVTRIRTSLGKLQTYLLPVPPLSEQQRIVNQFRILQPLIKEYEIAEGKRISLNEAFPELLKKSILQQAVMGKLVPQDPNDEPASVLLERIRAEKEALIKAGKLKKDKHESIIYRRDNSHYEKLDSVERCIDDEIPFEIPTSWEWVRFGNIINLQSGQDLTPDKYNDKRKGIPYITGASNIEDATVLINRWTEHGRAFAYRGDLLLTCKGTVGTMAFLSEDRVHIARQIMSIHPYDGIDAKYARIVLETLVEGLKAAAKSMIPGISREDVLKALFPLPPLNEQRRIAEMIDIVTYPIVNL